MVSLAMVGSEMDPKFLPEAMPTMGTGTAVFPTMHYLYVKKR